MHTHRRVYFVIASGLTTTALKVSATSGGAAVDITDTGTGTHTIQRYDNDNAFFGEPRAALIASRLPQDSLDVARQLNIPIPVKYETQTDPVTGLTVMIVSRLNTGTLDVEMCYSAMWGSAVGRQAGSAAALMDNAALRIIES